MHKLMQQMEHSFGEKKKQKQKNNFPISFSLRLNTYFVNKHVVSTYYVPASHPDGHRGQESKEERSGLCPPWTEFRGD